MLTHAVQCSTYLIRGEGAVHVSYNRVDYHTSEVERYIHRESYPTVVDPQGSM